jgi:cell division protein FtsB
VIVYLLVMLGQTVKRNYDLGKQINDLHQQITLLQAEKDQQAYNIQYYKTDSFRDRQARSQLGLQAPGESVIIIPHGSPEPSATPEATATKSTATKSNFQQWLDFIGGKS